MEHLVAASMVEMPALQRVDPAAARTLLSPSRAAAHRRSIQASSRERRHDVSILIGLDGRVRGVEPCSTVSMMIMRPPQHAGPSSWGRHPKTFTESDIQPGLPVLVVARFEVLSEGRKKEFFCRQGRTIDDGPTSPT